jgi:hypothetical protein
MARWEEFAEEVRRSGRVSESLARTRWHWTTINAALRHEVVRTEFRPSNSPPFFYTVYLPRERGEPATGWQAP